MNHRIDNVSEPFFLEINEQIIFNPHKDDSDKNGKIAKVEPMDKIKHPAILTLTDGYLRSGDWYIGCLDPEGEFADATPACWTKDREAATDFQIAVRSAEITEILAGECATFSLTPGEPAKLQLSENQAAIVCIRWKNQEKELSQLAQPAQQNQEDELYQAGDIGVVIG